MTSRSTITSVLYPVVVVIGIFAAVLLGLRLVANTTSEVAVVDYQLVLIEEAGDQKLAIQYCLPIGGCRLMGYRWDPTKPSQTQDAEKTFNFFKHPPKTKVLSVVK